MPLTKNKRIRKTQGRKIRGRKTRGRKIKRNYRNKRNVFRKSRKSKKKKNGGAGKPEILDKNFLTLLGDSPSDDVIEEKQVKKKFLVIAGQNSYKGSSKESTYLHDPTSTLFLNINDFLNVTYYNKIIYAIDTDGTTALHKAAGSGGLFAIKVITKKIYDDINKSDIEEEEKKRIVEFINRTDNDGNTALHKAIDREANWWKDYVINANIECPEHYFKIVMWLLLFLKDVKINGVEIYGVDPMKKNNDEKTAHDLLMSRISKAKDSNKLVRLGIQADSYTNRCEVLDDEEEKFLKEYESDSDYRDSYIMVAKGGQTWFRSEKGIYETSRALLEGVMKKKDP